jgi:hypothetical protein
VHSDTRLRGRSVARPVSRDLVSQGGLFDWNLYRTILPSLCNLATGNDNHMVMMTANRAFRHLVVLALQHESEQVHEVVNEPGALSKFLSELLRTRLMQVLSFSQPRRRERPTSDLHTGDDLTASGRPRPRKDKGAEREELLSRSVPVGRRRTRHSLAAAHHQLPIGSGRVVRAISAETRNHRRKHFTSSSESETLDREMYVGERESSREFERV